MNKILATALLCASPVMAEENPFVDFRALKPSVNLAMAQGALDFCNAAGFQIGVMVTDRFGIPQVFLRDQSRAFMFLKLHIVKPGQPSHFARQPENCPN